MSEKETNDESSKVWQKLNTDQVEAPQPPLLPAWLPVGCLVYWETGQYHNGLTPLCYSITDFVIQTRTIEGMEMPAEMALLMVLVSDYGVPRA